MVTATTSTRRSEPPLSGHVKPLIDTEELAERLEEVVVCDLRWSLTDPSHGRSTYEEGHIPGAVFVDLDRDLAEHPGLNGRHPLPPVDVFARTLGRLGIGQGDEVVAYDDSGGSIAARMWWMLRAIDHTASRVLDGGYKTWVGAGHPVETGWTDPVPKTYPPPRMFHGVVTIDHLRGKTIVDARSAERYRGDVEPVDPKAGHIPGAINLPHSGNLAESGSFLPPGDLSTRFAPIGDGAVMSCGSGVTSCHNALAMVVAGRDMPLVYVGSFSEWSRRDMPVRTGDAP